MKNYNREKASAYAQKWALRYNPEFYHFAGIGGDCTNFISQCLLAGGCPMVYDKIYGWFYISSYNRSASWTSVKYLQKFLLSDKQFGVIGKIQSLENLEIGDLIQLRQKPNTTFNHTLIITKIEQNEIFVCAHTNNALNKPLSSYEYEEVLGIHILGIK